MKRFLLHFIADMVILAVSFTVTATIYQGPIDAVIYKYQIPFVIFLFVFLAMSFWLNKYEYNKSMGYVSMLNLYAKALFYTAGISVIAMYLFQFTYYSRFIILGTMLGIFTLEFFWVSFYQAIRMAVLIPEQEDVKHERVIREALLQREDVGVIKPLADVRKRRYRETILEESGIRVLGFLEENIDIDSPYTQIIATTTRFNLLNLPDNCFHTIVNLKPMNDVKRINKFLEAVNIKLQRGGTFVNAVETLCLRKDRIFKKYPPIINLLVYRFDSLLHRVAPKIPFSKKLYFKLTSGKNRVLSKAEIFGRLYSCGFEIADYKILDGLMWFSVKRVAAPVFDFQPTYGPLIHLKRVGKDGKIIKVYKMRTMHAYSEYLQEYVYKLGSLQDGGKFKNDFRITRWGRILRALWIDELPMLLNLFNGDLKLVGVRPLSKQYFSLYSQELQEKRKGVKPGLIPPYYAQFPIPKTLEEIMENEDKYLDSFFSKPFRTDFIYFSRAFYNIVFRRARSK